MKKVLVVIAAACTWEFAQAAIPLPPQPNIRTSPVLNPWAKGTSWGAFLIRTDNGVVECPRPYIEQGCRPYVRGRDRRPRAFVRLEGGRWLKCPDPVSLEKCVGIRDLPNMRVQE